MKSMTETAPGLSVDRDGESERRLYTARLLRKVCLSKPAQCFHLEFKVDDLAAFDFAPGQFVSLVADDAAGKSQTRAYSMASAPRRNEFDLCADRVEGGFFSNLLCDLEEGQTGEVSWALWFFPAAATAD